MSSTLAFMRPKKAPTDNVRIDHAIAKKARMVAAAKGLSLPDYLNGVLKEPVDADLQEVVRSVSDGRRSRRAVESS